MNQCAHMTISIQTDHGNVAIIGRRSRRLDIHVQNSVSERLEQPPMIVRLQAAGKIPRVASFEGQGGGFDIAIVQVFSPQGDSANGGPVQERGPVSDAFLPEPAFRRSTDSFEMHECRSQHCGSTLMRRDCSLDFTG